MKKIHFFLILTIPFFFNYSCYNNKKKYDNTETFSYLDIPSNDTLRGEVLNLEDIYRPMNLYIQDSVLFVISLGNQHLLTCYNMNDLSKIGNFIPFGSGPNESLGLKSLQIEDPNIWAFDKQLNKISLYSYSQFLQAEEAQARETIKMQDVCFEVLVIADKIFANTLSYPDSRFSIYDIKGEFIENRSKIPVLEEEKTDLEKLESFFGNMALKPESDLIFVSYFQTDLIEIYDTVGNLMHRTHGPDHFFPVKKESTNGGHKKVSSIAGETRDAYFYPVALSDEIWTLYSGKVFVPDNYLDYLMDKIIIFNWEGKPMKMYTLDIPIYSLAIDEVNRIIYGVSEVPDLMIVRFRY